MSINEQAYVAMLETAVKVGLPRDFKNELIEGNRKELICGSIDEGEPFGWVLYPAGSRIFRLHANSDQVRMDAVEDVRDFFDDDTVWFYWNGDTMLVTESREGMLKASQAYESTLAFWVIFCDNAYKIQYDGPHDSLWFARKRAETILEANPMPNPPDVIFILSDGTIKHA